MSGFVVGVSGGIDSSVTSILCAETDKRVVLLNMPIRQRSSEFLLAKKHIEDLRDRYSNVESHELELTDVFGSLEKSMPFPLDSNQLSMANSRARLRMMTLYAVGQAHGLLVVRTHWRFHISHSVWASIWMRVRSNPKEKSPAAEAGVR